MKVMLRSIWPSLENIRRFLNYGVEVRTAMG